MATRDVYTLDGTGADRSWWGELWAERSTASAFAEQAVAYGIATRGDLADIAAAWREWAAEPPRRLRGGPRRGHYRGVTGWRQRVEPEDAMATATALDHLVLVVSDIERALAWYGRHAGLDGVRVEEWRNDEAPFPSLRIDDSTIIDLVPGDTGADRGHLDHICFVVSPSELDDLASEPELEVVERGERFGARGLGRSIYVHDPDGLLVEFRCYPE